MIMNFAKAFSNSLHDKVNSIESFGINTKFMNTISTMYENC